MDAPWPQTWPEKGKLHVFDPEGDVLLILERCQEDDLEAPSPSEEAPLPLLEVDPGWPEPEPHLSPSEVLSPPRPEDIPEWLATEPEPDLDLGPPEAAMADAPEWLEAEPEPVRGESQAEKIEAVHGLTEPGASLSICSAEQKSKAGFEEIHMRVSSRHLILASPTFRTCLGSSIYPEGRTLQSEGHVAIPLLDEDPDAMIILLNIIHGLSSKVPRRVDLDMLTKIAIAVNHRQMYEAVGIWSDTWIENLKQDEGLPSSYTTDALLSWLFIFWVFRDAEGFQDMSKILERECDDSLENEVQTTYIGRYIPASIIRNIEEHRTDLIESMITVIHDLITKYCGPDILCGRGSGFTCDANVLGSLLKSSTTIGIWPRPRDPYPGISSKMLASQIREMRILDECHKPGRGHYISSGCHEIKALVIASMEDLEISTPGLCLTSFLPEASRN